jgi:hypothetical protein
MTATTATEAAKSLGLPLPTLEWVKPSLVTYDPRVQRPEEAKKLIDITDNFEPAALNVVSLSRRKNGVLVCLDGQHRLKAAVANGYDDPIHAAVFEGLTMQQEAKLFRLLNNTTKVGAMALFNVAVTEKQPQAIAIQAILDRHGLVMNNGDFAAISTARKIVEVHGVQALDWSLQVILTTWGKGKQTLDGRVLEALAMLYTRSHEIIDTESLTEKMTQVPQGLHGLLGKARTVRELKRGRIQVCLVEVLIGLYNSGKRKNLLPEWVR